MTTSREAGGERVYPDPDHDSPSAVSYRDNRDSVSDDELQCAPTTPLLFSDVPTLSSSSAIHAQSVHKAASPSSPHTSSSLADLFLSTASSGLTLSSYRLSGSNSKRHAHSPASFLLSSWCASLGLLCVAAAVVLLLVTAVVYGIGSRFTLTAQSSSSSLLPLLTLTHNTTKDASLSLFPADDVFARASSRCHSHSQSTEALSWPFSAMNGNVTRSHTAWVGLMALLFSQTAERAAIQEAVMVDGYSVASFDELVQVMDRRAGRSSAELTTATVAVAAQEVAIHVVNSPANAVKRAELDSRLRSAGYSEWTYHSNWTQQRIVEERAVASQWLYPAFANITAAVTDSHLNMLEHVSALQAIAASPASAPSFAVVLEDDAVPTVGFQQRVQWMTSVLPASFDAVFFGGCLNLHPALTQWQATIPAGLQTVCQSVRPDGVLADCSVPAGRVTPLLIPTVRSRCSSGYLVSRVSAARLLVGLQAATRRQDRFIPIDHSLNDVFAQLPSNHSTVYQLEPPASYESSKLLQFSQPTAPAQPQRTIDSIDYTTPVAFVPPAQPKKSNGVLAPSAGGPMCDSKCGWSRPFSAASLSRAQSSVGTDWSSYISPTSFRDMTDWVYWLNDDVLPPHERVRAVNDSVAIACLPAGAFIYSPTSMLLKFFSDVHPALRNPYFLITGSADQETPAERVNFLDDLSADGVTPKLLHWFGQNGNSRHPRFTQIPIGINFHEMGDSLDQTLRGHNSLKEGEPYSADDGSLDLNDGERFDSLTSSRRFRPRITAFQWSNVGDFDKGKSLLANFALDSNPAKRGPPLTFACGNDTEGVPSKPWAQCVEKSRGVSQYVSSMPAVYHHNSRFRFHLSPEGNGLDCHRTWEALYLGVVPVVKSGPLDPLLADTPAWIVNDWSDITEDSMEARWKEVTAAWRGRVVERLHFSYWKNRVIAVARRELEQWKLPMDASWADMEAPRRRCWGPINQRQDRKAVAR